MGANWEAYRLPDIWRMLEPENACTAADRVLSWDTLAGDVRSQHRRLLKARDDLAAVWPPDTNESARVFIKRVNELAASMDHTLKYAEDTKVGLNGVIEAISEAKLKIQPLVSKRAEASNDLIPSFVDSAEEEYDKAARKAMRSAEAAIADHSTQIKAPTLYELLVDESGSTDLPPTNLPREGDGTGSGGSGGGSVRATPRPVPFVHEPSGSEVGSVVGVQPMTPVSESRSSSPFDTGSTATVQPLTRSDLELAGFTTSPTLTTGVNTLPDGVSTLHTDTGPRTSTLGTSPIGLPSGIGGTAGVGGMGGMGGIGMPGGRVDSSAGRQAVPVRRGLPSGVVIGGVGPEGGVGGGRGNAGTPMGTPMGRNNAEGKSGGDLAAGEADLQWGVANGVAPVITPDTHPVDHDPGPGVIGFRR